VNGFYPAMRHEFVSPGAKLRIFVVSFDPAVLSWEDFRNKIIGARYSFLFLFSFLFSFSFLHVTHGTSLMPPPPPE
jgi:hypothetical protein